MSSMQDQLETAWGIIANVSGGDWRQQTPEWIAAAQRWRDSYFVPTNAPPVVGLSAPEPPPVKRDDLTPTWEIVIEEFKLRYCVGDYLTDASSAAVVRDVLDDMTARDQTGRAKYGVPLTAFNGRDQLVDAYQEALDLSVYLRAAMDEGVSGASAVYSNTLHNIFWLRVAINGRAARVV